MNSEKYLDNDEFDKKKQYISDNTSDIKDFNDLENGVLEVELNSNNENFNKIKYKNDFSDLTNNYAYMEEKTTESKIILENESSSNNNTGYEFNDNKYDNLLNELKNKGHISDQLIADSIEAKLKLYLDQKFQNLENSMKESYAMISSSKVNPNNEKTKEVKKNSYKSNKIFESQYIKEEAKENEKVNEEPGFKNLNESIVRLSDNSSNDFFINLNNKSKYQFTSNTVFLEDYCGVCSSEIIKFKYCCIVCEGLTLCEECEKLHNHPVVKFKDLNLSKLKDAMIFLDGFYEKSLVKKYTEVGMFDKVYKAKLTSKYVCFSMRPKTTIDLYLEITNDCKYVIPENTIILAKHNKDLFVETFSIKDEIQVGSTHEFKIAIKTNEMPKLYDFQIILYNKTIKVEHSPLRIKIDCNTDYLEEELNTKLENYPKLLIIPKEAKIKIVKIMTEQLSDKHPYLIYQALYKYDFNLERALNFLYSMENVSNGKTDKKN